MPNAKCKFKRKANQSVEWNDGKKDRIYCYGYNDERYDELFKECFECRNNIRFSDEDYEKWKAGALCS
jgi:hypothetical protein